MTRVLLARPLVVLAALAASCEPPAPAAQTQPAPVSRCRVVSAARPLGEPDMASNSPFVTASGQQFGVVWGEREPTHAGAHFALVSTDGVEATPIELGENEQARTRDVHLGGRADGGFVTAWHESVRNGNATSYLRLLSPSGAFESPPIDLGDDTGDIAAVADVGSRVVVVRTSTSVAGSQILYRSYTKDAVTAMLSSRHGATAPAAQPLAPASRGELSDQAAAFTSIDSMTDGHRLVVAWTEPVSSVTATQMADVPEDLTFGTTDLIGPDGPLPPRHVALGMDAAVVLSSGGEGVMYTTPAGDIAVTLRAGAAFSPPVTLGPGREPDGAFLGDELLVCATDNELATHVTCQLLGADGQVAATLQLEEGAEDVDEIDVASIGQRALVVWQQSGAAGTQVMGTSLECAPPVTGRSIHGGAVRGAGD